MTSFLLTCFLCYYCSLPGPLRDLHLHPRPNATSADLGDLARSVRPGWERSGPKLESKTVLKIMNARLKGVGVGLPRLLTGLSGASKEER